MTKRLMQLRGLTIACIVSAGAATLSAQASHGGVVIPYDVASDAEAIYRGSVIAVEGTAATLRVTEVLKGPGMELIDIWTGSPPFGPTFNRPPVFVVGEEVVVGIGHLEGRVAHLWPSGRSHAGSRWPRDASAPPEGDMTAEEAGNLFRTLVAFTRAESFEERHEILSSMLTSSAETMRRNAIVVLRLSTRGRIPPSPRDMDWWKVSRSDLKQDLFRAFLPELSGLLEVEAGSTWANEVNRNLAGLECPGVPMLIVKGYGYSTRGPQTDLGMDRMLTYITRRWSRVTPAPEPGDPSGGYAPIDLPSLEAWAEQVLSDGLEERRATLEAELLSSHPLARAAARGEWVFLFGEEPPKIERQ